MLRAEAGLVNSWCIYGFKLTRGLRASQGFRKQTAGQSTLLFPAGGTSPLPLQGEQRIPYKMPEPWQVGHSRVGALVEVVIGSDHTLYLFKAYESCKYPGCFAFFYRGGAELRRGREVSRRPSLDPLSTSYAF
jgi:hypothetical protein